MKITASRRAVAAAHFSVRLPKSSKQWSADMTNRSLLDYLGEPADPAFPSNEDTFPVDQLRARLAELEERLASASRAIEPVTAPEPPLASQIQSILKRRDGLSPERAEAPRQVAPAVERHHERLAVQAPPLAPEAFASGGDFGRFVDAVQSIGEAAKHYLQQSREPAILPRQAAPQPRIETSEVVALSDGLKQVLGALQDMTGEFRTAAEEMRRNQHDTRRVPEERHASTRRVSRDDAELFRLQDDLDELRERLGALTHRRGRNPY